jgi:hypothetical protein
MRLTILRGSLFLAQLPASHMLYFLHNLTLACGLLFCLLCRLCLSTARLVEIKKIKIQPYYFTFLKNMVFLDVALCNVVQISVFENTLLSSPKKKFND